MRLAAQAQAELACHLPLVKLLNPRECARHAQHNVHEELECVQGMSAKIHVEPRSILQFCKVRPVPFALCGRVE